MLRVAAFVAFCTLQSSSPAQQVRVLGELTEQAGVFQLLTPTIVLLPGSVDLSEHVGDVIDVHGTLVPNSVVTTIAVTSAERSDHEFELNGSSCIGETLELRVDSPTALSYYLVASFAPGFTPLDSFSLLTGTLLVSFPTNLVHAGLMQGSWEEPLPIPNNPALVGLEIWFQGVIFDGMFLYLNAEYTVITS